MWGFAVRASICISICSTNWMIWWGFKLNRVGITWSCWYKSEIDMGWSVFAIFIIYYRTASEQMKYLQNIETFYWDDTHKKSFICTGYWFQTTRLIISTLKVKPTLHFVISWHIELLTVTTSQTLCCCKTWLYVTERSRWLAARSDQYNKYWYYVLLHVTILSPTHSSTPRSSLGS